MKRQPPLSRKEKCERLVNEIFFDDEILSPPGYRKARADVLKNFCRVLSKRYEELADDMPGDDAEWRGALLELGYTIHAAKHAIKLIEGRRT